MSQKFPSLGGGFDSRISLKKVKTLKINTLRFSASFF